MEALGSPPPATEAFSAVLDDDDLLCEILLRVAYPTCLVRAALVCKSWLRVASAPAFLRRFRCLHPPRLLGFYVTTSPPSTPRFVPIPQPPELSDVVRRGTFNLELSRWAWDDLDVECWNGLLLLSYVRNQPNRTVRILRSPLYPARHMSVLRPVPNTSIHAGLKYKDREILPNDHGDGLSYFYLGIGSNKMQLTIVDVYVLQDGIWVIYSSAVSEIPRMSLLLDCLIGDHKIYNLVDVNHIDKLFLLDLVSSSLSLVNLPEEVDVLSTDLSLADGSGVLLTHVKDLQIRIWLHRMDKNGYLVPFFQKPKS